MDFVNHREGGWFSIGFLVFYRVFLLSPLQCIIVTKCKRLRKFEEKEISMQSCRGDCQEQGGKLLRLLSRFCPRIRPLEYSTYLFFPKKRCES